VDAVAYLLGLLCGAPLLVFALGLLALGHAISTRNPFVLVYEAALAFVWGLPLLLTVSLALFVFAFFRRPRLVGSALFIAVNVAALVFVLRSAGLPRSPGEAVFLGPTLVSLWLHGRLLLPRSGPRPPRAVAG
jgi:hypothetical protein